AIILGDPEKGCPYRDPAAEPTYSGCGRVVWWHPPLECCDRRKAMNRKAWFAATHDRASQHEADRLAGVTPRPSSSPGHPPRTTPTPSPAAASSSAAKAASTAPKPPRSSQCKPLHASVTPASPSPSPSTHPTAAAETSPTAKRPPSTPSSTPASSTTTARSTASPSSAPSRAPGARSQSRSRRYQGTHDHHIVCYHAHHSTAPPGRTIPREGGGGATRHPR